MAKKQHGKGAAAKGGTTKGSSPKTSGAKGSNAKGSGTKSAAASGRDVRGGIVTALAGPSEWRNDDLGTWGKVAWFTLLALAFLVPVALGTLRPLGIDTAFANDIYDTFKVFLLRIGVAFALFAWVLDTVRKGSTLRTSPVFWVFLAFIGWSAVATVLSISPGTAFFGKYRRYDGFWSYTLYGIILFLTVQFANRPGRIKQLAQTITAASAIIALYGLMQAAGADILDFQNVGFEANRSFSTYGNPDLLAGYLAFGIFVPLALALSESSTAKRATYWGVFLLSTVVSITAFSRSIWVGSVVGFAAIVVFAVRQRSSWSAVDWAMSGTAAGAGAIIAVRSLGADNAVMNFVSRVSSIFNFSDGSASTRFMIWGAAMKAIAQRPIFGFGPDTFRLIFRRFQPDGYAALAGYRSVADNVHDYPLQLAAGVGIPGALMFYGAIAWSAVIGAATCWRRPDEGGRVGAQTAERGTRLLLAGFWAAAAAYVTHLMFGLSLPATTFLLFMAMGVLIAPSAKTVEVPAARPAFVTWGAVALAAVVLVGSIGLASTTIYADSRFASGAAASQYGQQAYQQGQDASASATMDSAIVDLAAAVSLCPYNDQYRYELFSAKAIVASMGVLGKSANATSLTDDAVSFGTDMIARNPWEYDSVVKVMDFYNQLAGFGNAAYLDASRKLGEENVVLTPNGMALRFVYADTLRKLGDNAAAIEQLEYAVAGDPNFAEAATALSEIQNGVTP